MTQDELYRKEFENIISFDNLYNGLKDSCRNVRWKSSVMSYEMNAIQNTYQLRQDLLNGKYKIQPYQIFQIHEPKERTIVATRIRDRQFQHSLVDNYLYDQLTKSFIRDNCACLRGRGVDDCLSSKYRKLVGLSGDGVYCNSGVLLINLKLTVLLKVMVHGIQCILAVIIRKIQMMMVLLITKIVNSLFCGEFCQ